MQTNRIPLSERLERLEEVEANDNAYNIAIIKKMADMPIGTYLAAFGDALDRLIELLGLSPTKAKCLYYRDIAYVISKPCYDWSVKDAAVKILALPFQRYCEERTKKNGKNPS